MEYQKIDRAVALYGEVGLLQAAGVKILGKGDVRAAARRLAAQI